MPRVDRSTIVIAVLVVLVGAAPLYLPKYWVFLSTSLVISALVARSVGVVTNQAGLISLCQMTFAAIGGWVVAWLSTADNPWPFPVQVLVGGLVAMAVGTLVGLPALRVRGVELAVVTLGFAVMVDLYISRGSFPGAGQGKPVIPEGALSKPSWYFVFCWVVFVAVGIGLWIVSRRRTGSSWAAVRTSERAAAALGVNVARSKVSAFAVAALTAGLAGGLLAGQLGLLTADVFRPISSLSYFSVAIMVGASLATGAFVAGALVTLFPELLRRLGLPLDLGDVIFALGAIDTLRRGKGGSVDQLVARVHERRHMAERRVCDFSQPPLEASISGDRREGTALTVRDLSVRYGAIVALDSVSFAVPAGQVHALIGPNGAGKSTLIDAVSGYITGYAGSVSLDGSSLEGRSAQSRALAGVRRTFQQGRAIEILDVGNYLRLAGADSPSGAAVGQLVQHFGLPHERMPISLLDVGTRRVLEVAAAVASRPVIALLDEPAAGLDEEQSLELARRIGCIPGVFGCSVLLVEHDMPHVRAAASTVTVLDFGQVIADGALDLVLADQRVLRAYLGEDA